MPLRATDWTVEMVHALPEDGNRYEVLDGQLLVSPSPSNLHQRTVVELLVRLSPYCKSLELDLLAAPSAVTWSPRTELQPDVLVTPRTADGRVPDRFEDVGVLELAVEVLSPSTARNDRFVKRAEYQRRQVPGYWIVDPLNRMVERWRLGDEEPEVLLSEVTWQPHADKAPLTIDLHALFAAAHGEQRRG